MNKLSISLSVLSLSLLAGCGKHETTGSKIDSQAPLRVREQPVLVEKRPMLVEVIGTVRPVQRALLAAKVMGSVAEAPPMLGQKVRKGELLVHLSAAELGARAVQAQSQLNQARRDLDRERDLLAKGASTAELVRSLEDRLAMTQAMVREAEVMLSYTDIRAPFDGVVSKRLVNEGDLASPGQPLIELDGLAEFQVETGIPDSLAGGLAPGALLGVEISDDHQRLEGKLQELSSSADPVARTVAAKIALPAASGIRSGQFVRVQVPGPVSEQVLVPATAVVRLGQIEAVYLVGPDKRAVLRLVRTGSQRDGRLEILSGLSGAETVVLNPQPGLSEGRKLEVQP